MEVLLAKVKDENKIAQKGIRENKRFNMGEYLVKLRQSNSYSINSELELHFLWKVQMTSKLKQLTRQL